MQETTEYKAELITLDEANAMRHMSERLAEAIADGGDLQPQSVAELYRIGKRVVEPLIKALEERVRTLADEGVDLPGIKVGEPTRSRRIVDAGAAYNALADVMEPGEFASCCTVRLSALERALLAAMRRDDPGAGKGEAQTLLAHKSKDADWMCWDERRPAVKIAEEV